MAHNVLIPDLTEAISARLVAQWQSSRDAVAGNALDDAFEDDLRGPMSLRAVYLHLIQEYARHNGHADLLRESVDGLTGE